jgi:hypothetical protein
MDIQKTAAYQGGDGSMYSDGGYEEAEFAVTLRERDGAPRWIRDQRHRRDLAMGALTNGWVGGDGATSSISDSARSVRSSSAGSIDGDDRSSNRGDTNGKNRDRSRSKTRKSTTMCESCRTHVAEIYCHDCRLHLCEINQCNSDLHKDARTRNHHRISLPPPNAKSSSLSQPKKDRSSSRPRTTEEVAQLTHLVIRLHEELAAIQATNNSLVDHDLLRESERLQRQLNELKAAGYVIVVMLLLIVIVGSDDYYICMMV